MTDTDKVHVKEHERKRPEHKEKKEPVIRQAEKFDKKYLGK